jgi:folylpolyglutamate synthase
LIDVRERIQINRRLLSEEKFAKYFWECYHNLISGNDTDSDASLPVYFGFLTVMACYVFLKEEIDVVIMEVGLGGEYDYTNVIRSPCVCGITSLGMDHIEILGSTLKEIAWQKAGIFKVIVCLYAYQPIFIACSILMCVYCVCTCTRVHMFVCVCRYIY